MKRTVLWIGLLVFVGLTLILLQHHMDSQEFDREDKELNRQVNELSEQGRYGAAMPLALKLLKLRDQKLGPEHPLTLYSLYKFTELNIEAKLDAAPLCQQLVSRLKSASKVDAELSSDLLTKIADAYAREGRFDEAKKLNQEAAAFSEQAMPSAHRPSNAPDTQPQSKNANKQPDKLVSNANSEETGGLFLPNTRLHAQIMSARAAAEIQLLKLKMEEAVLSNPRWFSEYSRAHENKRPLPYHKNFGISEQEYRDLLQSAENSVKLEPEDEIIIEFAKQTDGTYKIDTDRPDFPLNNIVIDLERDMITTEYEVLEEKTQIDQTNPDSPTGQWSGVQWKYVNVKETFDATVVKLALGRQKDNGNYIVYYDVKVMTPDIKKNYSIILYYQ